MISTATTTWLVIGAAFGVLLPFGAMLYWRKTRKAKWLPFLVGALTFIVFAQVLEGVLHYFCLLSDNAVSRAINGSTWLYVLYGALAAGIFEETGRYVAFRWILRKDRYPERDTAVSCGIGHGGIEALIVLAGSYLTYFIFASYVNAGNLAAATALAGGTQEALTTVLAAVGQVTPGIALLSIVERVFAMLFHVALSIFVFLAARDRTQWTYFPFAIALHAIADAPAALCQRGVLPLWSVELWIAVFALYALRSARKCYLEMMDP